MKEAGYRLEFETDHLSAEMVGICDTAAEGTGWYNKTETARDLIFVRKTLLEEDDLTEEGYEDGDTLFQRACFALAERYPDLPFTGICNSEDENTKIRITVTHTAEELRFRMRKNDHRKLSYRMICWYRDSEGSFVKSELGSNREKDLEQRREK